MNHVMFVKSTYIIDDNHKFHFKNKSIFGPGSVEVT